MLLGQIIDRYGMDLADGMNLSGLLRAAADIDGLVRIRFLTSHPNWLTDELLDTVSAIPKICPHIEAPIQSGNDDVLAAMRRGYTVDQYRALIGRIRDRIPQAAINTDIIIGFPGETEPQFMDTYRVLEELRLDKVHIAKYSVRPKTMAARSLPDDVPKEEKERRRRMLDERQSGILAEKNAAMLGRTVRVLVEDCQRGRWRGRTPDNRIVFFESDRVLRGQVVDVRIDWSGPFSLLGRCPSSEDPALSSQPAAARR
jgi:tRNA-2-methylthio-N6-dimethylallyladenosine synthase